MIAEEAYLRRWAVVAGPDVMIINELTAAVPFLPPGWRFGGYPGSFGDPAQCL